MCLFSAFAVVLALGRQTPTVSPPKPIFHNTPRFEIASPLTTVPGVMIDSFSDGVGLAQEAARAYGLQARILWIDATANIDKYNTEAKIVQLVNQIKTSGFNTIVFDIKPISGQVMYKSAYAPKLTEWRGSSLPADFDPLTIMAREAKAANLTLFVSMNAFSEGHRLYSVGPGYEKKDWQTVVYDCKPIIRYDADNALDLTPQGEKPKPGAIQVFSSAANIPKTDPDGYAVLVGPDYLMENSFEEAVLSLGLSPLPPGSLDLLRQRAMGLPNFEPTTNYAGWLNLRRARSSIR